MAHFLFMPHVVGPENHITSPDIVIDKVSVVTQDEETCIPVQRLCAHSQLQALTSTYRITVAYALVAGGGGVLLAPAALIYPQGQPAATAADIVIARMAWRLRNVLEHFGKIGLSANAGGESNHYSLSALPDPRQLITDRDDDKLALPRGVMKLCAATTDTMALQAPGTVRVQLSDERLNRQLNLDVSLDSIDADRWGKQRPLPRYTVGPLGEVKHYI